MGGGAVMPACGRIKIGVAWRNLTEFGVIRRRDVKPMITGHRDRGAGLASANSSFLLM
jgi:hypothetical protein